MSALVIPMSSLLLHTVYNNGCSIRYFDLSSAYSMLFSLDPFNSMPALRFFSLITPLGRMY